MSDFITVTIFMFCFSMKVLLVDVFFKCATVLSGI